MMGMIMPIRACKLIAPYISFTHIIWSRPADKLNLHLHLSTSLFLSLSDKDAHTSFTTQGKAGEACHRTLTPNGPQIKQKGKPRARWGALEQKTLLLRTWPFPQTILQAEQGAFP